jgi:DNA-binding HxlR family transcriptional regulator
MASVSSSVPEVPALAYLPVTAATDLLGDRWSLPIIREILHGNENFNDICRALPGISRSLLAARLRSLSQRGLIESYSGARANAPYRLTEAGSALRPVLEALGEWALNYRIPACQEDEDGDAEALLSRIAAGVNVAALPQERVLVQFHFENSGHASGWLEMSPRHTVARLGVQDRLPDLTVRASTSTFHDLWRGRRSCDQTIAARLIHFEGPPALAQGFRNWFSRPIANEAMSHHELAEDNS